MAGKDETALEVPLEPERIADSRRSDRLKDGRSVEVVGWAVAIWVEEMLARIGVGL